MVGSDLEGKGKCLGLGTGFAEWAVCVSVCLFVYLSVKTIKTFQ